MICLLLSLYLKIIPHNEIKNRYSNRPKISESYSNVTNAIYKDQKYADNFINSQTDDPQISFCECSFSNIVPSNYFSDSSLIHVTNSQFHLNGNNLTSCSFSTALFYIEGSNFTMNNNQITSCYNFGQSISISNIIRCLRTISQIQFNTITFDDISHSCRGLYFAECNDTTIRNVTITNSNILRNHGNAIMFSMTTDPKIRSIIENSNFINCGESDYVIYSTLNTILLNQTQIIFSEENDQKVGGIYFPNIANFTFIKTNFINIPGSAITFSDEEMIIKPYSIRINRCNFERCQNCILCKLRGDELTFTNFTFQELEFDSTLLKFEGNTEIINFNSVVIQSCPKTKSNENFIIEIPKNNREFNFNQCTISSTHFSCSRSCIYFGRTGRYTFRKTNLISLDVAGILFSDEENDEENYRPLEIELLDDTSFPMCGCCVMFSLFKHPVISNCLFDNLIFQSDLITFNRTMNKITIESSNFSKCYSSYQGTSIIELPSNDNLDFYMNSCIFNYTHLLSGTAIEILNRIHSVSFFQTLFVDIEGDIFIDIDKSSIESPGDVKIVDCSFKRSKSSYDGAAIRISSTCAQRMFEINGCLFENCYSKKNQGGAISFNAFKGKICRCKFIDNDALKGSDIFYNVDKKLKENDQFLSVEGNFFIRQKNSNNDFSLFFFNIDNATNFHFHHNKFFINESLSTVYLFDCDESSKNVNPSISIENNCMLESNKEKIKPSKMNYEINYESAFQWICIDIMNTSSYSCPEIPPGFDEIYNGADFDNGENKRYYTCSEFFSDQLIIQNSILNMYHCMFVSIKPRTETGGAIFIALNNYKSNEAVEILNSSFQSCENKIGGAVYIQSSEQTVTFHIKHCNFTGNKATNDDVDDSESGNGGSMYLNLISINVKHCIFNENLADKNGGAIFYHFYNQGQLSPDGFYALHFFGCEFVSNSAKNRAGGIFLSVESEISKGAISVDSCTFDHCEAKEDGGGALFSVIRKNVGGQILVQFSAFKNCKAGYAGAVYAFSDVDENEVLIKGCTFVQNEATLTKSVNEHKIGGSCIFLSIKNGSVDSCVFKKCPGKNGLIKVVDVSDEMRFLSDDRNHVSIENCHFNMTVNSIFFVLNKNSKNKVRNCSFYGEKSYHINGVSIADNSIDSQKVVVESCKFESEKTIKDSFKKFVLFENNEKGFLLMNVLKMSFIAFVASFVLFVSAFLSHKLLRMFY